MVHPRKYPLLTFDLGVMVTQNVAQYPSHHGTLLCQTVKEMHLKEIKTVFDLAIKGTLNIVQYPLHHVTYSPARYKLQCPTV